MRYSRRYIVFTMLLFALMLLKFQFKGQSFAQTVAFRGANLREEDWNPVIAADANQKRLSVNIDGREYTNLKNGLYMDDQLKIMIPADMVRDAFDCGSHLYGGDVLVVELREDVLRFDLAKKIYSKNKREIKRDIPVAKQNGRVYLPFTLLAEELQYSYQWDKETNTLTAQNFSADAERILPYYYDLREKGRATQIKDQGAYGTCWAFAALTALESSMLPETKCSLSVDHMNQNNSFTSHTKDGGVYTMAMAYLAAWQGPVNEADDPYGDGKTNPALEAVMHVQDMHIIEAKDLDGIKEAVFKYGGVESCIYTTMQGAGGESSYYNNDKYAYCYVGEEKPNHDVVIIGWDDNFPQENFRTDVGGDGAFICQNSWGSDFGENGVFYVSYYDTNIGIHNLVYTGIESADNYDHLYQSDLCGWVGQMGYNKESIFGANVFTSHSNEDIAAAGFYTTGEDTDYKVYIVPDFTDTDSFNNRMLVAQGQLANAGYHTVSFDQSIRVEGGRKFAVVVWLSTPNAVRPMAIEYAADELTQSVDLEDGEGYISAQGRKWADARESSKCNLCIKAYSHNVEP